MVMRIRWSTTCAGCRILLPAGSQAQHAHRGHWCTGCFRTHLADCTACQTTPAPKPQADDPVLF